LSYQTFIDAQALYAALNQPDVVIVDCRFSLADTDLGRRLYAESHIPGAVYTHIDDDLSGPPTTDFGRHPLPTPTAMRALFGRMGITDGSQVFVYDNMSGIYAGRLWWMLRYMGHTDVAILDGGWDTWLNAGLPTRAGTEVNAPVQFTGSPRTDRLVLLDDVTDQPLLIDSRDAQRFRGEAAGLDPKAGHIPGAKSHHFSRNWDEHMQLLPTTILRTQFTELLGSTAPEDATFYCGSGVTACVNIAALLHAGFAEPKLYNGSWSEWSRTDRPIETGS
jgi:thiosulfate/3-mercaptopyruvate sulfurtransferase